MSRVKRSPQIPIGTPQVQNPPEAPTSLVMAARFSPLTLPVVLIVLPQNYAQRIVLYDGEEIFFAQQHMNKLSDFIDLEEVVDDDANMRLLAQFFFEEVKKWFRGLQEGSLHNYNVFDTYFIGIWEDKKNPLHILTQYNNMKNNNAELVQ